jgi:hypothetical protein
VAHDLFRKPVATFRDHALPPNPDGTDAKNTNVIKREPDTIAGSIVPIRGGRLPLPRQYLPILWLAAG